jgi:uncharacterized damage-inducible protein DinB
MPNAAKCQPRRETQAMEEAIRKLRGNIESERIPEAAFWRAPAAVCSGARRAVWHLALFGISRRSGFRALRDFAPFGISRPSGFRALRDFAPFGISRPLAFRAVRQSRLSPSFIRRHKLCRASEAGGNGWASDFTSLTHRPMLKQLLVATALIAPAAGAQSASPTAEAHALWKSVIVNLNQAADELSETMYAYRPTPEVRSVGELFAHIAGSQKMYCAMALGESVPGEGDVEKTAKTKAAIVAALKESNAYCERAYSQPDSNLIPEIEIFGTKHPKFYALIANASHDGEHYGNIVTYMRLNKLVPPSSRPRPGGG